jgi:hypothetical protein
MRRRRARGTASVEWVVLLIVIALAGAAATLNFARTVRCEMAQGGGHSQQCNGSGSVRLETADDGCIGLVCQTAP